VAQPHWLIPDRPLPFAALQAADADLHWSVASIASRGVTYQSASLRILVQDGRLRIDPATILAPGGPVQLMLQADASAAPPTVALVLRAPNLDGAALAAAAGIPDGMTGALDIGIDLHATGATPHLLAATATGRAAAALTGGEIENAALARLFGPVLRGASIPFDAAGRSRVACLALRLDATNGQADVKALALDTSKLRLDGDGTLDLGTETLDLHLRPTIRLGPTSVAVPVHLAGPWRAPKAAADRGVIAPGRFGISIGAATPDPCGPALAAVNAP
jgi:AsmA protein